MKKLLDVPAGQASEGGEHVADVFMRPWLPNQVLDDSKHKPIELQPPPQLENLHIASITLFMNGLLFMNWLF